MNSTTIIILLSAFIGFALIIFIDDALRKRRKKEKKERKHEIRYSKFQDYLFLKRKFLIVWALIHSFALFVNVFGIEGALGEVSQYSLGEVNQYSYTSEYRLFTIDLPFSDTYKDFWPFVGIYKTVEKFKQEQVASHDILSKPEIVSTVIKVHYLRGVFAKYDISEFIAYNLLLLVALYLRYDYLKNKLSQI